jgi:hypothetical protein
MSNGTEKILIDNPSQEGVKFYLSLGDLERALLLSGKLREGEKIDHLEINTKETYWLCVAIKEMEN